MSLQELAARRAARGHREPRLTVRAARASKELSPVTRAARVSKEALKSKLSPLNPKPGRPSQVKVPADSPLSPEPTPFSLGPKTTDTHEDESGGGVHESGGESGGESCGDVESGGSDSLGSDENAPVVIATHGAGGYFGELALFAGMHGLGDAMVGDRQKNRRGSVQERVVQENMTRRKGSAKALCDCIFIVLHKDDFELIVERLLINAHRMFLVATDELKKRDPSIVQRLTEVEQRGDAHDEARRRSRAHENLNDDHDRAHDDLNGFSPSQPRPPARRRPSVGEITAALNSKKNKPRISGTGRCPSPETPSPSSLHASPAVTRRNSFVVAERSYTSEQHHDRLREEAEVRWNSFVSAERSYTSEQHQDRLGEETEEGGPRESVAVGTSPFI